MCIRDSSLCTSSCVTLKLVHIFDKVNVQQEMGVIQGPGCLYAKRSMLVFIIYIVDETKKMKNKIYLSLVILFDKYLSLIVDKEDLRVEMN